MDNLEVLYRLLLSALLSGIIGLERETHGRAAGLRTHILVGVAATLIMLTSIYLATVAGGSMQADPGRVAAGVVTGIGFIGAGTIMRFRASVKGLTTAASIWASAGVGLAVGCGFYMGAAVTTAIMLFCLVFLGRFERSLLRKNLFKSLQVTTASGAHQLQQIRGILADYKAEIKDLGIEKLPEADMINLQMDLKLLSDGRDKDIIQDILRVEGVQEANWINTIKRG